MKELGDQWIEVIDGKRHMLKAVEGPKETSHISARVHPCFKCFFQMDDYDCSYPSDKWVCDMQRGVIIKDLGILNEDGCLPCPFCGEYPNLENNGYFWYCCTNDDCLAEVGTGKTKQEAIDIWNRRAR